MHQEVEAMAHGLDIAVGGDVHLHAGNGKGRHRIRASFQAVRPKCRQALHPPERRISGDSYTPRPLWTAPQWVEPVRPKLSGGHGFQSVNPTRGGWLLFIWGVARRSGSRGEKRTKAPRGTGAFVAGAEKIAPEGGTSLSAAIARRVRSG